MWYRLLGLAASFYRNWHNLGFLLVVVAVGALGLWELLRPLPPAPPTQVTAFNKLARLPWDSQVLVEGTVLSESYLQEGSYNRYFPLVQGEKAFLVRFNSSEAVPVGKSRLVAEVAPMPKDIGEALRSQDGRLGGHRIDSQLVLEVGFGQRGEPWLNWSMLMGSLTYLLGLWLSLTRGHIVFRAHSSAHVPRSQTIGEIRGCGDFDSPQGKVRLYCAPISALAWRAQVPVLLCQSSIGVLTLAFQPPPKFTQGVLYGALSARPALQFEAFNPESRQQQRVHLDFDTAEDRAEFLHLLAHPPALDVPDPQATSSEEAPAPQPRVRPPYKPPEERSFRGLPTSLAAGLPIALCLGALYSLVNQAIHLLLISPLLLGAVLGWLLRHPLQRFHCRNRAAILVTVWLTSLTCLATGLFCESRRLRPALVQALGGGEQAERILTPWTTLRLYLELSQSQGFYLGEVASSKGQIVANENGQQEELRPAGDFHISGWGFWLYLGLELFVIGWTSASVASQITAIPYCSGCRRWAKPSLVRQGPVEASDYARSALVNGEWERLAQLPRDPGLQPFKLTLCTCPGCDQRVLDLFSSSQPELRTALVITAEDEVELRNILT